MSLTDLPNSYPVELPTPDISAYEPGNAGIPYLWRFDSGAPGPHVMLSAIVHGNEPCGAIALDALLRDGVRPVAGVLTLAFMNVAAYQAFDPADPNATRWLEEDFNRVWDVETLDGPRDSIELRRAREVRPALEEVDFLLDLHSMQHLAPPLMMTGRHARAKALAAQVGVPKRMVGDFGHAAGRRMRDYGAFDDPDSRRTALLIECGQHWQRAAGTLACEAAARFLLALGVVGPELAAAYGEATAPQEAYTVTTAVTVRSEQGFRFVRDFSGGEVIARAGTVIGYDGDTPVTTPEDEMMLVMPSRRLWAGQTAVRLATRDQQSPEAGCEDRA